MSKLPSIMDPTFPKPSKPARVMAKNTVTGRVRRGAKDSSRRRIFPMAKSTSMSQ